MFYRPDERFLTTNDTADVVRNVVRNKTEEAVLSAISENPAVTADKIAEIASKSPRTVQRYLNSLQEKGMIRRVGSTKSGIWELVGDSEQTDT
ncbi:MAG: winged helix-turn-helix transcriptional regulator [Clostridiales Family XIII bacterium]|nr:winged helix-turn-helix transcriptional regulator [Clostridiales Family XIII bacterium]